MCGTVMAGAIPSAIECEKLDLIVLSWGVFHAVGKAHQLLPLHADVDDTVGLVHGLWSLRSCSPCIVRR